MVAFDAQNFKGEAKDVDNLNSYLANYAYVNGFTPSQDDASVLKKIKSAPNSGKHPHAARWYKHVSSFNASEQSG